MKGALLLAIIPELAIFVFICVCAIMVRVKGGPIEHILPLILVFWANVRALKKVLRRRT